MAVLERLGHDANAYLSIEFLTLGSLNRVYTALTPWRTYVLKVPLPVDHHFKTESDVATTELVRDFTIIPVSILYTRDSCVDNDLGLEWILMDKVDA